MVALLVKCVFMVFQIDPVTRHERCSDDESSSYSCIGYHLSSFIDSSRGLPRSNVMDQLRKLFFSLLLNAGKRSFMSITTQMPPGVSNSMMSRAQSISRLPR